MNVLHYSNESRKTYHVEIKSSILFECALGIASYTYTDIHDSLDKSSCYWMDKGLSLSKELIKELKYVQKHNTWKTILFLLHEQDFDDIELFHKFVDSLTKEELTHIAFPYAGEEYEKLRIDAAKGVGESLRKFIELTKGNTFYPAYIDFIAKTNKEKLKNHLCLVMELWYKEVIHEQEDSLKEILNRDKAAKEKKRMQLHPEDFVEAVTMGITYPPEPGVFEVLLIPQVVYRPWNVVNDLKGTKVFYYSVDDHSLQEQTDRYQPKQQLVQRFKLLGDELRLKIIKHLMEKERGLQELQEIFEIPKTTLHHHINLLRAAQLIKTKDSKYTVNQKAIESLQNELHHYLMDKQEE